MSVKHKVPAGLLVEVGALFKDVKRGKCSVYDLDVDNELGLVDTQVLEQVSRLDSFYRESCARRGKPLPA